MNKYIRTDLALEMQEEVRDDSHDNGIEIVTDAYEDNRIKVTKLIIKNEMGERLIGKPIGKYITIEGEELRLEDEDIHSPFVRILRNNLSEWVNKAKKILVIGLGNRGVTPDALGPLVVDNLYITRHLLNEGIVKNLREISAISPGVMAQTGIETQTILKALCDEVKPDIVIAIDALAAREPSRLSKTIQICDTGISPGSGVGNNRAMLNEETLGVKVIAIGVPTVISVPAIVNQALDGMIEFFVNKQKEDISLSDREKYSLACDFLTEDLVTMFVTPKNVDECVKRVSYTISEAINSFFEL